MNSIHIEPLRADQLDVWLDWRMRVLSDVFACYGTRPGLKDANNSYIRRHFADGSCVACFAYEDETEIGCGGACLQEEMPSPDNPNGRTAYLMDIYVMPELRGRGVGRDIVNWLLAASASRGITKIMLESTEEAQPLYRSLGFQDAKGYMLFEQPKDREG